MMGAVDLDTSRAIELAPRIWWVGALLPGDPFQCHVYLVEQGDESALIDPGSALTAGEVMAKVDDVVGVENLRWLVCSHSDPDIISALPALVARGLRPEAAIVTHWRDKALIRHLGVDLPYWLIEENGWRLELEDRALQFLFTPYAHFAGAFCTFDETSGTLFSPDLFGGFVDDDHSLFATSMAYFEQMRAFHEHYMPSGEILAHALAQIRQLPVRTIAPQHGLVIPEELVTPLTEELGQLECGIYLLARDDPDLRFLLSANRTVRDLVETLVRQPEFSVVVAQLAETAERLIGAERLELWARTGSTTLQFDRANGFAGRTADPPADVLAALSGATPAVGPRLMVPLLSPSSASVSGMAVLEFGDTPALNRPTRALLEEICGLVEVGLERELFRRAADIDRDAFYDQAIHDPLTGLYNRQYLADAARRLCALDDRTLRPAVAALMIDLDHFKAVNDGFGHSVGDQVLRHVARSILEGSRRGDIVVRYGGEEFLVLLAGVDQKIAQSVAERIRTSVGEPGGTLPRVTASVEVALRDQGEPFDRLVERADEAMYLAKAAGRDRVGVAE
ncbi:MAG: diguanylate cyclase [Acidimicrobiales bacterium]|jgi:diguanylate cyclase (GGDEF)-like protein